ncbi:MAG: hypothetical protein F3742_02965 [Nitrospinae bacterium]|nr:hypothetical protein [Nitrospinota bacterium]
MAVVRKAREKDFETVSNLFPKFNNSQLTLEHWKRLFQDPWNCNEDYFGYLLDDGKKAVGFLGYIFSRRKINGIERTFCSLTSWVVEDEYRSQSILLFLPGLKLREVTLTIFTASKLTFDVTKKLGFSELETHLRIIPPWPSFKSGQKLVINEKEIQDALPPDERQLVLDHSHLSCRNFLIRSKNGNCLLIVTRTLRKNFPFAHVHYLSNRRVFLESLDAIKSKLCMEMRTVSILVEERYLEGTPFAFSSKYALPQATLYKSDVLDVSDIDSLYSELVVLNP